MIKSIVILSALCSPTLASVTLTADILDSASEGQLPPSNMLIVDVFADVPINRAWVVAGVRAIALNGATLNYAADPNTGQRLLRNVGTENRFTTFFSRPRPRDEAIRFNNAGADYAGRYAPTGPTPRATSTEINIAYYAVPLSTAGSPGVDGYIFRIALSLPAGVDPGSLSLFPGRPSNQETVYLASQCEDPNVPGTASASFGGVIKGIDWWVGIPEPSTAIMALLGSAALLLLGRRQG